MNYYTLKIGNLERKLPIVAISPKISIASFNLLGDREIVEYLASKIARKLKAYNFDYLVGPEVKVVPLLQELSRILGKKRYVVCRKQIHGYMVSPISSRIKPSLVVDGNDAKLLKGKKVIIVDDVVSSGRTVRVMDNLMSRIGAKIIVHSTVFIQGEKFEKNSNDLIYLGKLPLFTP